MDGPAPQRLSIVLMTMLAALLSSEARAQDITLDPPAEGVFVLDHADMIDAPDESKLAEQCAALLNDTGTTLLVVTINAMSDHWPYGSIRIETFGHLLFDQWGVGSPEQNTGMLLLVSKTDRKARIQLGADWGRRHDAEAQRIMDRYIIARFKRGRFSEGIMAGAAQLDALARRGPADNTTSSAQATTRTAPTATPPPPTTSTSPRRSSPHPGGYGPVSNVSPGGLFGGALGCGGVLIAVVVIMVIVGAISRSRSPYQSYGPRSDLHDSTSPSIHSHSSGGFLSGMLMGGLLSSSFSNRSHRHSSHRSSSGSGSTFGGSSFGGGSFGGGGGGFSGGGGASGGW